jgi:putative redox protein
MAASDPLRASAATAAGTLRQDLLVDGRHRLVTDLPVEAGGTGLGPSPHELFPAALAGCVASTLAVYARTKSLDLGEIAVDVEYERASTPRRCRITVRVDAELTPELHARLARVAAACPLRRSLEAGFEFEEQLLGRSSRAA